VLGYPVFSVGADDAADSEVESGLYYTRVDAADTHALHRLCGRGYRVVDVTVMLARHGEGGALSRGTVPVAPLGDGQGEAVLAIAGRCFEYSRFHRDPLIAIANAHRVKREWIRSYVEGRRGIELLVATQSDGPVGFLAVLEASDGARVIDLVGVAPEAQRRGVGESLVATFVEVHGAGGRELRVGTQVGNIPSLRLYEKLGFRVVSAAYVLHRHVGA
jgi:ribosomal protein S18 acetylase RimI-like enzyme